MLLWLSHRQGCGHSHTTHLESSSPARWYLPHARRGRYRGSSWLPGPWTIPKSLNMPYKWWKMMKNDEKWWKMLPLMPLHLDWMFLSLVHERVWVKWRSMQHAFHPSESPKALKDCMDWHPKVELSWTQARYLYKTWELVVHIDGVKLQVLHFPGFMHLLLSPECNTASKEGWLWLLCSNSCCSQLHQLSGTIVYPHYCKVKDKQKELGW